MLRPPTKTALREFRRFDATRAISPCDTCHDRTTTLLGRQRLDACRVFAAMQLRARAFPLKLPHRLARKFVCNHDHFVPDGNA